MKYLEYLNNLIKSEVAKPEHLVVFGQNINAGSRLGGLTRDMAVKASSRIINTPNAENSLVGFGLGLMMEGARGIFFMKQMDFLLLGVDPLVNTFNIIRSMKHQPKSGSFTIGAVVVDSGYEGPQSALNNFADFCSLAGISGFTVTNKIDAYHIFHKHLTSPGFRIIGISQRLLKEELIAPKTLCYKNSGGTLFQYDDGWSATIVCFNFTFPYGWEIREKMIASGMRPSLFNVNSPTPIDWREITASVKKTGKLVGLDDSKSRNLSCHSLIAEVERKAKPKKLLVLTRKFSDIWFKPNADRLEINYDEIIRELK